MKSVLDSSRHQVDTRSSNRQKKIFHIMWIKWKGKCL